MTTTTTKFDELIALLEEHSVPYRVLEHEEEGRTEIVSRLRGHPVRDAAKCMVVMVKLGKKHTRYVLAVVPGDARVDLSAIKVLLGGTYACFATPEQAEQLAGCVVGTILPFTFTPALELVADQSLLESGELYFNAARLDRSIAMPAAAYLRVARPRLERIAIRT